MPTGRVDEVKFPPSALKPAGFLWSLQHCLTPPNCVAALGQARHAGPGHKDVACRFSVFVWFDKGKKTCPLQPPKLAGLLLVGPSAGRHRKLGMRIALLLRKNIQSPGLK